MGPQVDSDMDKAVFPIDTRVLTHLTVADLISRYRNNVTKSTRGHVVEQHRLNTFLRFSWADKPLNQITKQTFASFRDQRRKQACSATVTRELGTLQSIVEMNKG